MMKIQFVKDKMRNTTCVALASILIVLLFTACGGVEQVYKKR